VAQVEGPSGVGLRGPKLTKALYIRGATIYDGTGSPPVRGDVIAQGDRIDRVGPRLERPSGADVVDADGLVLAPGFIDLHSHADFTLPAYPDAINSLSQGVTSEVIGNCGYSPAPLSGDPEFAREWPEVTAGIGPDLDWGWRTFGEYLDVLGRSRPAVNCVPIVGFGALRVSAMGMADRPATTVEITLMRERLAEALAAGAWGMSTGLVYPPGAYAATDEIVEVGRALTPTRALYASHIRNEADDLVSAVDEALEIGRTLDVPVEVSHLKAAGQRNHGHIGDAIARIADERGRGRDVHCDVYPYDAGSTFLSQVLPPWIHEGGVDALVDRLRSQEVRRRVRREVDEGLPGWPNLVGAAGGWDRILIASVGRRELASAEGRTVADLARAAGADPLDWTLDLLVADRAAPVMIITMMDSADVEEALRFEASGIGSDQLGVTSASARVHPRCYGTFARILGRFVRERGALSMETAIHKMSGMPAAILGAKDRGVIEAGRVADLVLFDPTSVIDEATYEEPTRRARGIEWVILGGQPAIRRGEIVDARLGRVVRRTVEVAPTA
jgi:N-acyl-D-aspartate/D-glutamate deacylase